MAQHLPSHSVRSLCRLVGRWHSVNAPPSARIHGRRDRILCPVPGAQLLDGGHLISIANFAEINAWLDELQAAIV